MGSSSHALESWVKPRAPGFLGCVPSDRLPPVSQWGPGRSLIVNYDPHARGGSHWCAIVWSTGRPAAPGAVWWFDSFGLAPDADDDILKDRTRFRVYLEDIAAHHGVSFNFNRFDFQSLDTSVCGHYSALACVYGPPSAPMKGGADVWHRLAMLPQPARDAALPSLVRLVE